MSARILIAIGLENDSARIVEAALKGCEILTASTLLQAERLVVEDGIDAFVIDIHFDQSQAMDLLALIRQSTHHVNTPAIIVRTGPTPNEKMLRDTFKIMKMVHAVTDYVELEDDDECFIAQLSDALARGSKKTAAQKRKRQSSASQTQ